jgi:hypothetical protein
MHKLIYCNFDKLEISYQGAVPAPMLKELAEAKAKAKREDVEQVLTIGNLSVQVKPNGAKGGYEYSFSTGGTGAIVAIKNNTQPKNYNLRISISSACLATKGIGGALEHIRDICNGLGARGVNIQQNQKQEPFDTLVESVARVDYCVDVLANGFMPSHERIVAHSRSQRKFYKPESEFVQRGNHIESVTIGKMPNKQVCVYDKTREIVAKGKNYWRDIWAQQPYMLGKDGTPNITIGENDTVWRFEVRVGKDALRNASIVTLGDMQRLLPSLYDKILDETRLASAEATGDNPSRWPVHPLWELFRQQSAQCFATEAAILPNTVITKMQIAERIVMAEKSLLGNLISYTALIGERLDALDDIILSLTDRLYPYRESDPIGIAEKYRHAIERYAAL